MRTLALALGLCGGMLTSGCWDSGNGGNPDDAGAGSGGTGGSGGTNGSAGFGVPPDGGSFADGGFGGTFVDGGFGGDSGFGGMGGTGGFGFCSDSNENCTLENRSAVCDPLLACDLVPGPLSKDQCVDQIDDGCVDCVIATAADEDGGMFDCTEIEAAGCQTCTLLVQPPQTEGECLEIAAVQPNTTPAYQACLCGECLDEFAACVGDDGCWLVVQCMYAQDCRGMSCYSPTACMQLIDEVGATSISVAMATELGNCSATTCDALND